MRAQAQREAELAVVEDAIAVVERRERRAVTVIQAAWRRRQSGTSSHVSQTSSHVPLADVVVAAAAELAEHSTVQKRSKRFGWLLGAQSKELRLEADGLVYTKGGGGKSAKSLPFRQMSKCESLPAKGERAWVVVMGDGQLYEFTADSVEGRDKWIGAVSSSIARLRAAGGGGGGGGGGSSQEQQQEQPPAKAKTKRTISFTRKKNKA